MGAWGPVLGGCGGGWVDGRLGVLLVAMLAGGWRVAVGCVSIVVSAGMYHPT